MPLPNVGTQPTAYARQREVHEQRSDGHAREVLTRFGAMASEAGIEFTGRHAITDSIDYDDRQPRARTGLRHDRDGHARSWRIRRVVARLSHTKHVLAKSQIPLLVLH